MRVSLLAPTIAKTVPCNVFAMLVARILRTVFVFRNTMVLLMGIEPIIVRGLNSLRLPVAPQQLRGAVLCLLSLIAFNLSNQCFTHKVAILIYSFTANETIISCKPVW